MTQRNHPTVESCEAAVLGAEWIAARGGLEFDTPLEEEALRGWHHGRTRPLRLNDSHLREMTDYLRRYPTYLREKLPAEPHDPKDSVRWRAAFGGTFGHPSYDALLGQAHVILDRDNNVIGMEDNFDFNDRPSYGPRIRAGMALVRRGRRQGCGTSGSFRINAGTGR